MTGTCCECDFTVQAALAHADIKTTGIYAHIKNEYLRAALEVVFEKTNTDYYSIFAPF